MQALKKEKRSGQRNRGIPGAPVAGIILAAGASRRMGTPKQLLRVSGQALLVWVLESALQSKLHRVILVLGHEAPAIRIELKDYLTHPKLTVIKNPRYLEGISSSIGAGLDCLGSEDSHALFLLGDMPHVRAELIDRLLVQYLASGLPMGAVQVAGRRTHPVIFHRSMFAALRVLTGDVGARALFLQNPGRACLVEPEGDYDDRDVDTPEDYLEIPVDRLVS